jgi:hypothetical protein
MTKSAKHTSWSPGHVLSLDKNPACQRLALSRAELRKLHFKLKNFSGRPVSFIKSSVLIEIIVSLLKSRSLLFYLNVAKLHFLVICR